MPARKSSKYSPLKRKVPLTNLQQEVYQFIKDYRAKHNSGPTFKEVNQGVGGGSKNNHMTSTLGGLRRRGMVTWAPRVARSLDVVKRSYNKKKVSHPDPGSMYRKEPALPSGAMVHVPKASAILATTPSTEFQNTKRYIQERIDRLKLELEAMEQAIKVLDVQS